MKPKDAMDKTIFFWVKPMSREAYRAYVSAALQHGRLAWVPAECVAPGRPLGREAMADAAARHLDCSPGWCWADPAPVYDGDPSATPPTQPAAIGLGRKEFIGRQEAGYGWPGPKGAGREPTGDSPSTHRVEGPWYQAANSAEDRRRAVACAAEFDEDRRQEAPEPLPERLKFASGLSGGPGLHWPGHGAADNDRAEAEAVRRYNLHGKIEAWARQRLNGNKSMAELLALLAEGRP